MSVSVPSSPRDAGTARLNHFVTTAHEGNVSSARERMAVSRRRDRPPSTGRSPVTGSRLSSAGSSTGARLPTVATPAQARSKKAGLTFGSDPWQEQVTLMRLHEHSSLLDKNPQDVDAAVAALQDLGASIDDEVAKNVLRKAVDIFSDAIAMRDGDPDHLRIESVLARADESGALLAPLNFRDSCDALVVTCERLLSQTDELRIALGRKQAIDGVAVDPVAADGHQQHASAGGSGDGATRARSPQRGGGAGGSATPRVDTSPGRRLSTSTSSRRGSHFGSSLAKEPMFQQLLDENTEVRTESRKLKQQLRKITAECEFYKAQLSDLRRAAHNDDNQLRAARRAADLGLPEGNEASTLSLLQAGAVDFDALFEQQPEIAAMRDAFAKQQQQQQSEGSSSELALGSSASVFGGSVKRQPAATAAASPHRKSRVVSVVDV